MRKILNCVGLVVLGYAMCLFFQHNTVIHYQFAHINETPDHSFKYIRNFDFQCQPISPTPTFNLFDPK